MYDAENVEFIELYRILVINQNFCEVKDPLDTTGFKTPKSSSKNRWDRLDPDASRKH